jgi:hypothetical protein
VIHAIATIHSDTSYVQPILQAALDGPRPRTSVLRRATQAEKRAAPTM